MFQRFISHAAVPFLDLFVARGQFVMAGVEKIFKHPQQVEIHKMRLVVEQEFLACQDDLKGNQPLFEFFEPVFLVFAPLLNAAAPEFSFFETQELQLLRRRDVFLVINVVEPERRAFDFVFDEFPQDGLDAAPFCRKQSQFQLLVEIFGDDLRIFGDFKNHIFAVADDRHAVIALLREFPDEGTVLVGNVCDFERRAGKFQDAPLDKAKRTPWKLNQFNHVKIIASLTRAL